MLKAIKAGETVVDLNKPTDDGGDGGDNPSNPSNPSGGNTSRQYTISVISANTAQGTVSGGGTYTEGSHINVSATPKAGFAFDKWSDGNTQASRSITVSQNLSLTASFKSAEAGGETGDNTGGGSSDTPTDFM